LPDEADVAKVNQPPANGKTKKEFTGGVVENPSALGLEAEQ